MSGAESLEIECGQGPITRQSSDDSAAFGRSRCNIAALFAEAMVSRDVSPNRSPWIQRPGISLVGPRRAC